LAELRIVVYGLIAAASPLALACALAVLRSRRGQLNGVVFACAFLLGGALVVIVVLAIGSVTLPGGDGKNTVVAVLELALGALALVAASRVRHRVTLREGEAAKRGSALLARLERLTPGVAFVAGGLLGIGGPKRLTISIVAATTLGAAGLTTSAEVGMAALYVLLASVLVWVPVAVYLVAGSRSEAWMESAEAWMAANQQSFTTVTLLVFGVFLVTDGLVQLV
jgi:Sap, sulfolipid-1-addressing protein